MTKQQRNAFLKAPIAATFCWYIVMLAWLLVSNGGLRLTTDVLAFALGAILYGLPLAFLITATLALPIFVLFRRVGLLQRQMVVATGTVLGVIVAVFLQYFMHPSGLQLLLASPMIGYVAADTWWRTAYRDQT